MSTFPVRLRDWPGASIQQRDETHDALPDDEPRRQTSRATFAGSFAVKLCHRAIHGGNYQYVILFFATISLICSFPGHSFMIAPYNSSVMLDLHMSPTSLSSIWAVTLILSAGWLNVVGCIVDRRGAQPVIFFGGFTLLAGLLCFSNAEDASGIMLSYTMVRLSSVETVDFACRHCINQWFTRRGIVAGVLNAVSSFGFLLPALETLSVVEYGWRSAAAGVGILAGSTLMLSSVFLLSQPEDYNIRIRSSSSLDIAGIGTSTSSNGCDDSFTFEEAVRTPLLWSLMFCWFVSCVPWAGINFLLVTILKEDHYSQSDSVGVYVMLGICSAVSALICGAIEDRIPHSRKQLSVALVNGAMFFAVIVGALLHWINGPAGPLLLGCGLGTWEGFSNVVGTTIIPQLYGRKHQGAIRGLFMASAQVSSGAGPLIISLGRDIGLSMSLVCCVLAMFQVLAIALISVVPRPLHRCNGSASLKASLLSA